MSPAYCDPDGHTVIIYSVIMAAIRTAHSHAEESLEIKKTKERGHVRLLVCPLSLSILSLCTCFVHEQKKGFILGGKYSHTYNAQCMFVCFYAVNCDKCWCFLYYTSKILLLVNVTYKLL